MARNGGAPRQRRNGLLGRGVEHLRAAVLVGLPLRDLLLGRSERVGAGAEAAAGRLLIGHSELRLGELGVRKRDSVVAAARALTVSDPSRRAPASGRESVRGLLDARVGQFGE
jgi:hypothetical protein